MGYMPASSPSSPDYRGNGNRHQTASSRLAGTISVPSRTPLLQERGRRCLLDGGVDIACEKPVLGRRMAHNSWRGAYARYSPLRGAARRDLDCQSGTGLSVS